MNEKEIRIFPNSQRYEFKTEEELDYYIRNTLRGSDRSGRYNFRNFRSVKNIAVGSVALFRFADKVLGWGVVSEKAVYLPFSDPEYGKYEGFIMFNPKTVKAFETPLLIKDLESITGMRFHFKDNYKTGRGYRKIPFQFKDEIQSHVTER